MVPRFTEFYLPVLQVMSDIEPIEINSLIDKVADHINLSEEDRQVLTESGNHYRYRSNICWAVTDLSQGDFIERVRRGKYVITLSGLELLEENFEKIDRDFLAARSESFRAFMDKKGTRKGKKTVENELICDSKKEMDACKNLEVESSEVSLDELYSIRETLKKAKISTNDIDIKIKELENENFFKALLPRMANLLPEVLCNIKESMSFTVQYIPKKEISIQLGNTRRTKKYETEEKLKVNRKAVEKKRLTSAYECKGTIIGATLSEQQNSLSEENNGKKSKGVWIEPYKDRMIIVKGDIDPFSDLFASYGGRIIKNSTEGWKGWIFMSNREEGLRKDLTESMIDNPYKTQEASFVSRCQDKAESKSMVSSSNNINRYLEAFNTMRRFVFLGISGPHKAILLIAIFKGIRNGLFVDNKIKFSSELESLYNENWNLYVGGFPSLGAVYPFVHLGRESFFMHKIIRPINDYDKTWSRHSLDRHIDHAVLDKKLFELVKDESCFERCVDFLSSRYCSESNSLSYTKSNTISKNEQNGRVIIQESMNYRDAFYTYLSNSNSKHGKSYSHKSIVVYVRGLNSPLMNELVSQYVDTSDIFDVSDLNVLLKIKHKVAQLCSFNKAFLLPKSALSLYIKYIESLC